MTRDEIMQMSADELRVAIAKKRGYPYPYDKYRVPVSKPIMLDAPYDAQPIPDFRVELRDVPDYLNDIAAAWELVEDWHKKEEVESIDFVSSYIPDENGIHSMVYSCYLRHSHITAEAPTAPLAICRAWLIWSEESGNGQ